MSFHQRLKSTVLGFIVLLTLSGCEKSTSKTNTTPTPDSSAQATPQSSPLTEFEQALRFVKNGGFTYIWVFSRKDGKPFAPEDSPILRTNAPQVVDWVRAGDKKILAGTNFDLEQGNLVPLRKRYVVELYTGP